MVRKYVVTCGWMLIICVFTKLFGFDHFNRIDRQKQLKQDVTRVREELADDNADQFSFANEYVPLGDKQIDAKMQRALRAHSFSNMQTLKLHERAEEWFPLIVPILKKYHIPEDFKYVPLVETGMERGQYSIKGAAGVWQFMPQTARDYGLVVNDKVDQRMNVRLATVAAARYLRDLYKVFKSWTLVAAAYNVGEGGLRRQISRQQQDNYFKMKLNHETGKYVYSLISMKQVIEDPEAYGYRIHNPRKLLAYKN